MRNGRDESNDDGEWLDGSEHATGGYTEDNDFDYEEYVEREFGKTPAGSSVGNWKKWTWRVIVVVVCLLLIWRFLLF